MALIENILYPVDFSSSCVAMAAYVKRAAILFGATVSLVHVVDLASRNGFELHLRLAPEISEEHRNIGRDRLDSFLTAEFPFAQCPRILEAPELVAGERKIIDKQKLGNIAMSTEMSRPRQDPQSAQRRTRISGPAERVTSRGPFAILLSRKLRAKGLYPCAMERSEIFRSAGP